MGFLLEGTEAAGPFGVEVRGESFYVSTAPDALVLSAKRNADGTARFGVPTSALAQFLAAVDQALDHQAARGAKLADTDPWVITQEGDDVVIGGPVITFGADATERRPVQSVELVYGDAHWLVRALAPLGKA
ncbi:hypothetical protein JNUCC0626_18105 [Lentzea sp. JNUCC 0626]|uniref:hypothetical protein n=1 Tax=Lentzea sp. JNUCC 0626 TaxID=3367513 RepID=UPI00374A5C27